MTTTAPPTYVHLTTRPVDCDRCGQPIATRRSHWSTPDFRTVICGGCIDSPDTHAELFPGCRFGWHDCYDHPFIYADRAAVNVRRRVMA